MPNARLNAAHANVSVITEFDGLFFTFGEVHGGCRQPVKRLERAQKTAYQKEVKRLVCGTA